MGRLENEVRKKDQEILCESSSSKDGGHSGMIFVKKKGGKKTVLAQTDPIFKTADEAKIAAEKAVKGIRSSGTKPIFQEVDEEGNPKKGTESTSKKKKKEGDKADGQ